ncbi:hypothetical protein MRX96_004481 [Rhipicephalus microplus]
MAALAARVGNTRSGGRATDIQLSAASIPGGGGGVRSTELLTRGHFARCRAPLPYARAVLPASVKPACRNREAPNLRRDLPSARVLRKKRARSVRSVNVLAARDPGKDARGDRTEAREAHFAYALVLLREVASRRRPRLWTVSGSREPRAAEIVRVCKRPAGPIASPRQGRSRCSTRRPPPANVSLEGHRSCQTARKANRCARIKRRVLVRAWAFDTLEVSVSTAQPRPHLQGGDRWSVVRVLYRAGPRVPS